MFSESAAGRKGPGCPNSPSRHGMAAHAHLKAAGVELLESPDALLGHGERGEVRLGCLHTRHGPTAVAVKLVCSPRCLPLPLELPALPTHPNIVRVFKRTGDSASWAEVRALCGGGEMYDRVAEEGSLDLPQAMMLFSQLASAVAHCHAHGVAHGQIRAEHVLLDEAGHVQLIGFGRASTSTSEAGNVVLRPVRALDAPEWHAGAAERPAVSEEALFAADIWSMAVLLAGMLRGGPPFTSSAAGACPTYAAFLGGGGVATVLGDALASQLPAPLAGLVERALQANPSQRPSAAELAALFAEPSVWRTPTLPAPSGLASMLPPSSGAAPPPPNATFGAPHSVLMPSPIEGASCGAASGWRAGPKGGWAVPNPMPARARGVGGADAGGRGPRGGPMPPVRPTASQGYVRSLGWHSLPQASAALVGAITTSLDRLQVPYVVRTDSFRFVVKPPHADSQVPPTPQSASPPLTESVGASPVIGAEATTSQATSGASGASGTSGAGVRPAAGSSDGGEADAEADLMSLGPVTFDAGSALQPLVIFIQIYREDATSARHDVSVRRVQGTSWRFQTFYAAFRDQVRLPQTHPGAAAAMPLRRSSCCRAARRPADEMLCPRPSLTCSSSRPRGAHRHCRAAAWWPPKGAPPRPTPAGAPPPHSPPPHSPPPRPRFCLVLRADDAPAGPGGCQPALDVLSPRLQPPRASGAAAQRVLGRPRLPKQRRWRDGRRRWCGPRRRGRQHNREARGVSR